MTTAVGNKPIQWEKDSDILPPKKDKPSKFDASVEATAACAKPPLRAAANAAMQATIGCTDANTVNAAVDQSVDISAQVTKDWCVIS